MGKQPGKDGFLGDAAVADDANLLDGQLILGEGRMGADSQCEHEQEAASERERRADSKHGLEIRAVREMEVCLIFTGLEPCGEHKCWCVPKIGFTGRICTPSLLKNLVLPQGKNDFNIPATKALSSGPRRV